MNATNVEALERSIQKTNEWLRDEMHELGTVDRDEAYVALRQSLHALRDRLTVEETAHLGAQLPTVVRGIFYDGWRPAGKPERMRTQERFLEHVRQGVRDPEFDAEAAAKATFRLLSSRVTAGEIEDVRHMLPEDIRGLWPGDGGAQQR